MTPDAEAGANGQRREVAVSSDEEPWTPSPPLSRTEKRVQRTRAAIEAAFVELVLEQGYENVSVEEIAAKADLAKATFYRHYDNKEALMSAVFFRVVEEGAEPIRSREGPWSEVRGIAIDRSYENADKLRDLYKVCLSDLRTRTRYLDTVTRYAEENFRSRLTALNRPAQVPVWVMARAFAGAHLVILESWLDGEIDASAQEVAAMELDLLVAGFAWAHNINLFDIGYTVEPPLPDPRSSRTGTPATTKRRKSQAEQPRPA